MSDAITVDPRFCGPPDSGNGGYVGGLLAAALAPGENPDAEVRLQRPPPLGRPLVVQPNDTGLELLDGEERVATARRLAWDDSFALPDAPSYAQAEQATRRFSGFELHWFPGCFVCGPERAEGDGLRIFPGPVAGSSLVAAPWQPAASLADDDGVLRPEFMWAALDCAGAFAHEPDPERTLVLGSLAAQLRRLPRGGERCIVVGWPATIDGRKYEAGTAVFAEHGELLGAARAVWIRIAQPG